MTWVKLDDQFYDNAKNRALGSTGRDAFIASICYCTKGRTDGMIPKGDVPLVLAMAQAKPSTTTELIKAGRWIDHGSQIEVAEYLKYNPSREKVLADRAAAIERMRSKRGSPERSDEQTDECSDEQEGEQEGEPPGERSPVGSHTPFPFPYPSPDPGPETDSSPPATANGASSKSLAVVDDVLFLAFWSAYPKHKSRGAAWKAWQAAIKKADPESIIDAARRYAIERKGEDPTYTPHGSSWLNQERWLDEPTVKQPAEPKGFAGIRSYLERMGQ